MILWAGELRERDRLEGVDEMSFSAQMIQTVLPSVILARHLLLQLQQLSGRYCDAKISRSNDGPKAT
jgi:hypothetical protein